MRWLTIVLPVAACAGEPSPPGPVDAAYDTARCLITGNYGDLGAKTGSDALGASTLTITLDAGPPKDSFFMRLVAGNGAFAGGLVPGTYTIGGVDANATSCGLCVNLIADIVAGTGPTKLYFATSGSVTLTATTPPAGTLSGLAMVEVTSGGSVVPDGCTATIAAMAFSKL